MFQYMKSENPGVVAAIQRRKAAYAAWQEKVRAWASGITGIPEDEVSVWNHGWRNDIVHVRGLDTNQVADIDLPGRWTAGEVHTRPYKNNPAYRNMPSAYRAEPVPGRPNLVYGSGVFGAGALFVHNSVAYSGFGFAPEDTEGDPAEFGWVEIRASEYMAAVEAEEDRRAAERKERSQL